MPQALHTTQFMECKLILLETTARKFGSLTKIFSTPGHLSYLACSRSWIHQRIPHRVCSPNLIHGSLTNELSWPPPSSLEPHWLHTHIMSFVREYARFALVGRTSNCARIASSHTTAVKHVSIYLNFLLNSFPSIQAFGPHFCSKADVITF